MKRSRAPFKEAEDNRKGIGEKAGRAEREFGHLSLYEKRKKEREGGRKEGSGSRSCLEYCVASGRQYAKCARRSTFECVSD